MGELCPRRARTWSRRHFLLGAEPPDPALRGTAPSFGAGPHPCGLGTARESAPALTPAVWGRAANRRRPSPLRFGDGPRTGAAARRQPNPASPRRRRSTAPAQPPHLEDGAVARRE